MGSRYRQTFLVVDDHRLFLEGMRHLLSTLGDDIDILLANSVRSALGKLAHHRRVDLLLVDISLPEMDGFALLQSLNERGRIIPTIVVSSSSDIADIRRCLEMGVSGFIHKDSSSNEMMKAIEKVLAGGISLPDKLNSQLEVAKHTLNNDNKLLPADHQPIGERQIDVLKLLDQGMSNKQIADVLNISEATVKYHIAVMFKHFGVKSRTACLHQARTQNLIHGQQPRRR